MSSTSVTAHLKKIEKLKNVLKKHHESPQKKIEKLRVLKKRFDSIFNHVKDVFTYTHKHSFSEYT